jgi:methyl-accepting chemotaxis protein
MVRSCLKRSINLSTFLLLASILLSIYIATVVNAQEEVPRVLKVDVSSTTVYRGYQTIEVTAYIYLPPGSSLRTATGKTVLSGGGFRQELDMSLITLTTPVTVVVDDEIYDVTRLLLIRVPVSSAFPPGPATLSIIINGTAVMGGTTYDLSRTYTFKVSVLDDTPVNLRRQEALLSLERARTLYSLLEGLGVSIPSELRDYMAAASDLFSKADNLLYALGDVDTALITYSDSKMFSERVVSSTLTILSAYMLSINNNIASINSSLINMNASINARLDATETSLKSLSDSISTLSKNLETLAKTLNDYSSSLNNVISGINNNLKNTDSKIDNVVKMINDELNTKLSSFADNINKNFNNINSTLSAIQIALIVLGVAIIVVGAVGFIRR